MGVTHSGKTGVNYWFRDFIAPTLGRPGSPDSRASVQRPDRQRSSGGNNSKHVNQWSKPGTTGHRLEATESTARQQVVQTDQPEFSGTAAPGSIIRLLSAPRRSPGTTSWQAGPPPIAAGSGRSPRTPPPKWTVPYGRDSLLSHTDDPTGTCRYSHPAAGTLWSSTHPHHT